MPDTDFRSGLYIGPHCSFQSLAARVEFPSRMTTKNLSLKGWKRHMLGFHHSEHGTFEVEALSTDKDRIQVVLLAHQHAFYQRTTPDDAERRAFHEGVISLDLAGQREFSWGEVHCRLESVPNKDWLVVAYSHEAKVPLAVREVIFQLRAHEIIPEDDV